MWGLVGAVSGREERKVKKDVVSDAVGLQPEPMGPLGNKPYHRVCSVLGHERKVGFCLLVCFLYFFFHKAVSYWPSTTGEDIKSLGPFKGRDFPILGTLAPLFSHLPKMPRPAGGTRGR